MIQMLKEQAEDEGRVLLGMTMNELEAGLIERARQFRDNNCEAKKFRMDVEALNYIRSNVSGIGERERLYHFYMDLRQ